MKNHLKLPLALIGFFSLFLLGTAGSSLAQNMIPNPSFEEKYTCPSNDGLLFLAKHWRSAAGTTADYFHRCNTVPNGISVPNNHVGNQETHTGDAYAGFFSHYSATTRDYIMVDLTDSLVEGRQYVAGYHYSMADYSNYAVDYIGMYFTNDSIDTIANILTYQPQIHNPAGAFLSETNDWVMVIDTFVATGGEKYMTLGVFGADSTVQSDTILSGWFAGYYYIDDVFLFDIDSVNLVFNESTAEPEQSTESDIRLYPNPVEDILSVEMPRRPSDDKAPLKLEIYSILSEKVLERSFIETRSTFDVSELPSGLYFVSITQNGLKSVRKFVKE